MEYFRLQDGRRFVQAFFGACVALVYSTILWYQLQSKVNNDLVKRRVCSTRTVGGRRPARPLTLCYLTFLPTRTRNAYAKNPVANIIPPIIESDTNKAIYQGYNDGPPLETIEISPGFMAGSEI